MVIDKKEKAVQQNRIVNVERLDFILKMNNKKYARINNLEKNNYDDAVETKKQSLGRKRKKSSSINKESEEKGFEEEDERLSFFSRTNLFSYNKDNQNDQTLFNDNSLYFQADTQQGFNSLNHNANDIEDMLDFNKAEKKTPINLNQEMADNFENKISETINVEENKYNESIRTELDNFKIDNLEDEKIEKNSDILISDQENKVSLPEVQNDGFRDILLNKSLKRMKIVFDLDETLINAYNFSDSTEHFIDLPLFKRKFNVCIREGVPELLKKLSQYCDIYINTNGVESYAKEVIKLLLNQCNFNQS
jgi:hypothetical protein